MNFSAIALTRHAQRAVGRGLALEAQIRERVQQRELVRRDEVAFGEQALKFPQKLELADWPAGRWLFTHAPESAVGADACHPLPRLASPVFAVLAARPRSQIQSARSSSSKASNGRARTLALP